MIEEFTYPNLRVGNSISKQFNLYYDNSILVFIGLG